jgi:hypothetical protein
MNCPFCGSPVNTKIDAHKCTHCGSSIFIGIEAYSKTREEELIQSEETHKYLERIEVSKHQKKGIFGTPLHKKEIIPKISAGQFQTFLDSIGTAGIYAFILTLLTTPFIYFVVLDRFLKSYSAQSLIMGSYLFYFVFGFAVIYATSRSLSD